jgi:DsbC/DsbD-like thiol-disulfide interchange protein
LGISCWAQVQRVTIKRSEQLTIARGKSASQLLDVQIQDGFHVNSDKPNGEYLIPLKLTWSEGPAVAESVVYPAPEEIKVGPDILSVFTGAFEIKTVFKAAEKAPAGRASIVGKLRYQACNNQMCFRPSSVEVVLPVLIE